MPDAPPRPMHPVYLPFTEDQVRNHFAPVTSGGDRDRHLKHYRESIAHATGLVPLPDAGDPGKARRRARQIERDERFWGAATLLHAFHAEDRTRALTVLLDRCLGDPAVAGFPTWRDALGGEQHLYLEANLPAPVSYRRWLAGHLDERVLTPTLLAEARGKGNRLEQATKVDAILLADTGFAVAFEAKVLSDASPTTTHDVLRNQIARTVDVLLDANPGLCPALARRDPARTCLVLLTPDTFRRNPSSRLYGWLHREYKDNPAALGEHLPHRHGVDWDAVAGRLGWLTFEDCAELLPGSCGWLPGVVGQGVAPLG
ncbi:hypothetical protein FHR75_004371 [Kineococcus radiotolerans]|uniref:Uncharacterized protein n=1 Tax=Kineococcus radiotolerans TaxID=131568 RepID=A0A7W4XZQ9_KINRA|nr:hypothetical protein [Kineococcus radiotolerans]MBB2903529.1 hypothetical protein [Kineococcus radiotolerans]